MRSTWESCSPKDRADFSDGCRWGSAESSAKFGEHAADVANSYNWF